MPEFTSPGGPLRQSILRSAESCMLSTKWQAKGSAPSEHSDLGTVLHAVYAEALRTMKVTGQERLPIDDLRDIARRVYAGLPVLLPTEERRDMRWLLWRFADMRWTSKRIMHVEARFTVGIGCPDGVTREFTGQPDVIIYEPPDTIIIPDHKTGQRRPPQPRDPSSPDAWLRDHGRAYLSDQGTYQCDSYSLLGFHAVPRAQRVIFREYHWRYGEVREAFIYRHELPQIEQELGDHLMKLETALIEGDDSELWRPRPGSWCSYCPRPGECPVPLEERREGAVDSDETMQAYSAQWVTTKALKDHRERALKEALKAGRPPARVGDKVLGWNHDGPGRRFGLVQPVEAPERAAEQAAADEAFGAIA